MSRAFEECDQLADVLIDQVFSFLRRKTGMFGMKVKCKRTVNELADKHMSYFSKLAEEKKKENEQNQSLASIAPGSTRRPPRHIQIKHSKSSERLHLKEKPPVPTKQHEVSVEDTDRKTESTTNEKVN